MDTNSSFDADTVAPARVAAGFLLSPRVTWLVVAYNSVSGYRYKTWGGVKRARLYVTGTDMSTPKRWYDIIMYTEARDHSNMSANECNVSSSRPHP
eukprot:SAG22_NODE_3087_length_1952_cov_31.302752_2_plen_96_part_00